MGNMIIDSLLKHNQIARSLDLVDPLGLSPGEFATLTLLRSSNIDDGETLEGILGGPTEIAEGVPIIFPALPRTRETIGTIGQLFQGACATPWPLAYQVAGVLDYLQPDMYARVVIGASGGPQEEWSFPCIAFFVLRNDTERPIAREIGAGDIMANRREGMVGRARRAAARGDSM